MEKGKELYLSYACAICHGKNGDGNGLSAKQYYPPPIDFHNPKAYHHGNTKVDIPNTIKFGVREERSGMPAFDHITEKELDQISSYLESLQVKEKTK
ncbi:MAG: cytochrome c [Candidatus Omnitrophica bacterium]|nr:cytochrome c [Candidatus Omnitrophota bacterium]